MRQKRTKPILIRSKEGTLIDTLARTHFLSFLSSLLGVGVGDFDPLNRNGYRKYDTDATGERR